MRRFYYLTVVSIGLTACSRPVPPPKAPPAPPPRAQLVLVGGVIHTQDPEQPKVSALAIRDGRIAALGTDEALAAWIGPDTKVVGLAGRTAVPGLVDAHMHLTGLGTRHLTLDLVGTKSLAEVQKKVAGAVLKAPPGQWILGRGWDQNDWAEHTGFPAAADLDSLSPDNPVALTRVDGHAVWANSLAMTRAKIGRRTRPASGGRIMKLKGVPTGIFIDNAMQLVREHIPSLNDDQVRQAILLGQKECLEAGLTGVHDMGVGPRELAVMSALDAQGELRIRVYAAHDGSVENLSPALAGGPRIPKDGDSSRLTVRAVKFYADGALGSRGAALLEPYSDDPHNSGLLLTEPAVLEARVRTASKLGFQVATHAIGDRANMVTLDIYRRVFGRHAWKHRPRIEHAQVLSQVDLQRFAQEGVIASVQPTHATSDMPWAEARIGSDRIEGAYAWQSLLTTNATVAAGSDAPVESIAPLLGLYSAVTRQDHAGAPEGGWTKAQSMKPQQALAAFTTGAAWAGFSEKRLGRLSKGYLGDITVLSQDPLTADGPALLNAQVMLTIINGEIVYVRGTADAAPITKTSTSAARSIDPPEVDRTKTSGAGVEHRLNGLVGPQTAHQSPSSPAAETRTVIVSAARTKAGPQFTVMCAPSTAPTVLPAAKTRPGTQKMRSS